MSWSLVWALCCCACGSVLGAPKDAAVRTKHGVYTSERGGVYLSLGEGRLHLWPEPWSAVACSGEDVVVWCATTASLRSLSGGWAWSPYRSGARLLQGVPALHLLRGAVVLAWPGYVLCVDRGVVVWCVDGHYLGGYGGYALVRSAAGISCIDRTGRSVLLPRIPGTPLRVSGGSLVVRKARGHLLYNISALISGRVAVRSKSKSDTS